MRRLGLLAVVLAAGACQRETAIVVEIAWRGPAENLRPGDRLRLHVGTAIPGDPDDFERRSTAFLDEPVPDTGLPSPYRYLLTPADGVDLDTLAPLQIVAAFTGAADRPLGFAPLAQPIAFGDGEIRTVPLEVPAGDGFRESGDDQQCIVWDVAADRTQGAAVGDPGDPDCDGFPTVAGSTGAADCGPYDPGLNPRPGDPERCDGLDQSCDGHPAPPLPCVTDGPRCNRGLTACGDHLTGQSAYGTCMLLPSDPGNPGGLRPYDPETCAALTTHLDDCKLGPDPLLCVALQAQRPRGQCHFGAVAGTCQQQLMRVIDLPAKNCRFEIVGGTRHAEWNLGFVGTNGDNLPSAIQANGSCAVNFTAIADRPGAAPRTVLVLVEIQGPSNGPDDPFQTGLLVTVDHLAGCAPAQCDDIVIPMP